MTLPSVKTAFLLHFAISLVIFIALAAIMRLIWFPGDLFFIDGGWQGLKIIAPIDLVLGPALTLCFYRPNKNKVKFDMAAIATVQIAALTFGVFTAYQQRTAAIVFAEHRFETLSYAEFKAAGKQIQEIGVEPKSLEDFPGGMPILVHAAPFDDFGKYLEEIMNGLPELRERSDQYENIKQAREEIAKYRVDTHDGGMSFAAAHESGTTVEIPASTNGAAQDQQQQAAEIYPLKGRYDKGTIEFDADTFEWIRITRAKKSATP